MAHTLPDILIDIAANPLCSRCGEPLPARPILTDTGRYCSVWCAETDEAEWHDLARTYFADDDKEGTHHG